MPRISKRLLDSVVYFYNPDKGGEKHFCGSGIIVSIPYADTVWLCALTAAHVLNSIPYPDMRINTADGKSESYALDSANIHYSEDYDLAIVNVQIIDENHDFNCIQSRDFLIRENYIWQLSPGIDTFMVGRFSELDEPLKNDPCLRFGNVSSMPRPTRMERFHRAQDLYIVDMHSRPGYSGAPVYAYWPAGSLDIGYLASDEVPQRPFWGLLGIHLGQIHESVQGKTGAVAYSVPSGMAYVLPVDAVLAELKHGQVRAWREAAN